MNCQYLDEELDICKNLETLLTTDYTELKGHLQGEIYVHYKKQLIKEEALVRKISNKFRQY